MHTTAIANGRRFFDAYVNGRDPMTIVDVGAMNLNGSLRSLAPPSARYIGVDCAAGPGVDVVTADDPYSLPFDTDSVDVVVSSSCFEHCPLFWVLFLEIARVLKPAGLFYLNAPANGPTHRRSVDCWRFYPDAADALVEWSRRSGIAVELLESFTTRPHREPWADYVAVFGKGDGAVRAHERRILDGFRDCTEPKLTPPR